MATVADLIDVTDLEEFGRVRRQMEESTRMASEIGRSVAPILAQLEVAAASVQPVLESFRAFQIWDRLGHLQNAVDQVVTRHARVFEDLHLSESILAAQRVAEEMAPMVEALMGRLRSPVAEQALEQLREAMTFSAAARLAHEAALLRYPASFEVDLSDWPEVVEGTRDIPGDSTESRTDGGGRSLTDRIVDAILSAVLSSALTFAVGPGGDTHVHYHPKIVTVRSDAAARVEPAGHAPMIERVPAGSKIIALDGEDRWCPVWPVRDLKHGWVFRRHLVSKE